MEQELNAAILKLQEQLEERMKEVLKIKKAINVMRATIGQEPLYEEAEEKIQTQNKTLRRDQYYGMPLAKAVKEIIRVKGEAMPAQDILDQLQLGGFDFPDNWKKGGQFLRYLAISLGKNRIDFVPIDTSEGTIYGVWEFYPGKKREREKKKAEKNEVEETDEIVNDDEEKNSK